MDIRIFYKCIGCFKDNLWQIHTLCDGKGKLVHLGIPFIRDIGEIRKVMLFFVGNILYNVAEV